MAKARKVSAANATQTMYVVEDANGTQVGLVTKFKNTRTEKSPWQVHRTLPGPEKRSELICNFYDSSVPLNGLNPRKYRHGDGRAAIKFAEEELDKVLV